MKILLIEFNSDRREYNEPLGIESIHAYCSRLYPQHELDMQWIIDDKIPLNEKRLSYDLIGVSLTIGTLEKFDTLYKFLKSSRSKAVIVVGNVIPTYASKCLLESYSDVLCILGEGEVSFARLINIMSENLNNLAQEREVFTTIPNLSFIYNDGIINTDRGIPDMEAIPLPSRAFSKEIKHLSGIARVEGSRGCSWNRCEFCCINSKYSGNAWRPFSVERVLKDIIKISELGLHSPYFTDEDFFGSNYERAQVLANEINNHKQSGEINKDMNFFISVSSKDLNNDNGIKALLELRKAGLREVFIGIESGSASQLRRFRKGTTVNFNIQAVTNAFELGLQVDLGFIFFDPMMTLDELVDNLKFLDSLPFNKIDSRLTKALRIQPHTSYAEKNHNIIMGPLDLNQMRYPYKFIDDAVKNIYDHYVDWELEVAELEYFIQAKLRGEISDEKYREQIKLDLAYFRQIDKEYLRLLIYRENKTITNDEYKIKCQDIKTQRTILIRKYSQV